MIPAAPRDGRARSFVVVVGARPNFMKAAPLLRILTRMPHCRVEVVHTGQHYDDAMSDVFFRELGLSRPDINLQVGSGSHTVQTATIMLRFEEVLIRERPDWLVVIGDVNSTLACTLVAAKMGVRVAHIEAGLRSFDRTMPEEINRIVTDALAHLHFTPSYDADVNLRREGIPDASIHCVGNIMIDTLIAERDSARSEAWLATMGAADGTFAYVTLHRPSNVDTPSSLRAICDALVDLSSTLPVFFPVHPRTQERINALIPALPVGGSLHLLPPVPYRASIALAEYARFVLTDSGGLQEETTFFRTPCLTLRPNTERPVTVTTGSNRLTSIERLRDDIAAVLAKPRRFGAIPPLWDGHTAERIASLVTQ